ncbi:2Fe-2S iron-sulfur cluster-binding protein [Streptomyces sp. M19]
MAGVMLAAGRLAWRRALRRAARVFCGIGVCFDCLVTVNGERDVRACRRRARTATRSPRSPGRHGVRGTRRRVSRAGNGRGAGGGSSCAERAVGRPVEPCAEPCAERSAGAPEGCPPKPAWSRRRWHLGSRSRSPGRAD